MKVKNKSVISAVGLLPNGSRANCFTAVYKLFVSGAPTIL